MLCVLASGLVPDGAMVHGLWQVHLWITVARCMGCVAFGRRGSGEAARGAAGEGTAPGMAAGDVWHADGLLLATRALMTTRAILATHAKMQMSNALNNPKMENVNNSLCGEVWSLGSIEIEFSMSKSPGMQSMSFVGAKSVKV